MAREEVAFKVSLKAEKAGGIEMVIQKERRKNYFIKKEFQRKFILRFCALVVLGSVISGVLLYRFSRGTLTTTFVHSRLSIVSTANYILPALFGASLITVVFISIATAVVVLYLSHRLAGPLYKIESSLKEVGAGDLTLRIKLRSSDEIAKMADCFNEMSERLRGQLLEIKAKSADLASRIDELTALGKREAAGSQQMQDTWKALLEQKEELDQAIDYFRVKA